MNKVTNDHYFNCRMQKCRYPVSGYVFKKVVKALRFVVLSFMVSQPLLMWAVDFKDSKSLFSSGEYFKFDPVTDGILLGSGLLLNGADLVLEKKILPASDSFDGGLERSDVNSFDEKCMFSYSKSIDLMSNIFAYTTLLAPVVLFSTPSTEWAGIGTMYAETLLLTWGFKELGKTLINRNRPYMYFDDYPQDSVSSGDFQKSFPSGHTALAFASATFSTYVFNQYFPDSALRIPVTVVSYSFAVTTAVLRVTSGSHFLTDVIVGAAIGSFAGYMVPWLHTLGVEKEYGSRSGVKKFSIGMIPAGMLIRIDF